MDLTAQVNRLEDGLAQLAAAQARTEAALTQLAQLQERTEEELRRLAAAQVDTQTQLGTLLSWQTGEDGRRKGARYEQEVARRAPILFQGGEGGRTDRESVQRRLTTLLTTSGVLDGTPVRPEDDPFLADLIWWKGNRIAVVEASLVVDEHDVDRAASRAETLRRAGADVLPVVIGNIWDHGETRVWAEAHHVAWKVGSELSPSLLSFLRSSTPPEPPAG